MKSNPRFLFQAARLHDIKFLKASAKKNLNIEEAFHTLSKQMLDVKMSVSVMTFVLFPTFLVLTDKNSCLRVITAKQITVYMC